MAPGALFADIGEIEEIFVQPGVTDRLLKERLMCARGAGGDNYSVQLLFTDNFYQHFLAVLRTSIKRICSKDNSRHIFH
jgi:hypothetical protein